ncbi:MAG TPA: histidinol-phosphatase [Pseudomonadales bacterium]|nr:histidinol-phosphatase [Pseudomonadales bacterium]
MNRQEFLHHLVAASSEFIRPLYAQRELEVETKADQTPVTRADKGAEALMRRMIAEKFPDDGILGEEFGGERQGAEFVWVLDPVDGTKSFVGGVPLWGTLIALLHEGEPILGCINQPILGQLLVGDTHSTTLNGNPVKCRDTRDVADALLLTTDWRAPAKYQDGPAFDRLARSAAMCRTWGDCYGYLLVATGWADVMLDPIMNPWDIAALVPVVRGAGGVISDWHGGPAWPAESTVVSATPQLHDAVIATLQA